MSDQSNDGFIDEVTDALRRDQLFAFFRRWSWLALLVVLLIVGGAAYNEWRKARSDAAAQAAGAAMLTALEASDEAAILSGLDAAPVSGDAAMLRDLLAASVEVQAGEAEAAAARLEAIAAIADLPEPYPDLARLKALMIRAGSMEESALQAALEPLSVPGRPFRMLALEQIALSQLRAGDREGAITNLQFIRQDSELTAGLGQRVDALLVSLGVDAGAAPAGGGL